MNALTEQQRALHAAQAEWHRLLAEGKVPEWQHKGCTFWLLDTPYWDTLAARQHYDVLVREHIPKLKMVRVEGKFPEPVEKGEWNVMVHMYHDTERCDQLKTHFFHHPTEAAARQHFDVITGHKPCN